MTKEEALLTLINRDQPRAWDAHISACTYNHKFNGGCAIGVLLDEHDANEFLNDDVAGIFDYLPEELKGVGLKLLARMQHIHDEEENWIDEGFGYKAVDGLVWSDEGRRAINKAIEYFNLDLPKLPSIATVIEAQVVDPQIVKA